MNLKGSKTEKNLKDAFAGESQANRRYRFEDRHWHCQTNHLGPPLVWGRFRS